MRKRVGKSNFAEWISVRLDLDFTRAQLLGSFVGFVLVLIAIAVAVGGLATILQFLAVVLRTNADHEAVRNLGLILVAVLGAPFVLWRATVAQQQANIAEQSHITDQINKAVAGLGAEKVANRIGRPLKIFMGKSSKVTHLVDDADLFSLKPRSVEIKRSHGTSSLLPDEDEDFTGWHIEVETWEQERTDIEWQGSALVIGEGEAISEVGDWSVFSESLPNIEVRVGAIYALERISQDSARDHIQIMEILTAYIRENAPVLHLDPSEEPFNSAHPRTDIQTALDVIGRRGHILVEIEHSEKYRLDLREVNLAGASFAGGNFEGALLFGCRLEASNFRSANLKGARLNDSLLNFSVFFDANIRGAIFDGATLNRSNTWNGSITMAAEMSGLSMAAADMSVVKFLPKKSTHSPTFATKDTKLQADLSRRRSELSEDIDNFSYLVNDIEIDDAAGVRKRLQDAGFLYWSPFDASDGSTYLLRAKLWDELGLTGFPYRD